MSFRKYFALVAALGLLVTVGSSCGDNGGGNQQKKDQGLPDITIDSGQQQDITVDTTQPQKDFTWPNQDTSSPDWPQQQDTYAGSPFGCQADADCFGQKCCATPWGVKLCAPACGQ